LGQLDEVGRLVFVEEILDGADQLDLDALVVQFRLGLGHFYFDFATHIVAILREESKKFVIRGKLELCKIGRCGL
jgi:hypothetical protein